VDARPQAPESLSENHQDTKDTMRLSFVSFVFLCVLRVLGGNLFRPALKAKSRKVWPSLWQF